MDLKIKFLTLLGVVTYVIGVYFIVNEKSALFSPDITDLMNFPFISNIFIAASGVILIGIYFARKNEKK